MKSYHNACKICPHRVDCYTTPFEKDIKENQSKEDAICLEYPVLKITIYKMLVGDENAE